MYCKSCGQANEDYSTYCLNDGVLLHSKKKKKLLSKENISFCKNCGQTLDSYDLYCNNCGTSLFAKNESKSIFKTNEKNIKKSTSSDKGINIKSSFIYSIIGFGVLFLISLILSGSINSFIQEELISEMQDFINIKLINPLDISLLLNLANVKFSMEAGNFPVTTLTLAGIPFLFLLIPFIIFFIMGIVKSRNNHKRNEGLNITNIIITGLIYGGLLSVISLLNRGSLEIPVPFEGMVSMNKNFLFFKSFFNGSLISILSLLLGYGSYSKIVEFNKDKKTLSEFPWLFNGVFFFLISIVTIIIASSLFIKFGMEEEIESGFLGLLYIGQFSIYAFLISHLGTISISDDYNEISLSLLEKLGFQSTPYDDNLIIFLYAMLLIPVIIFFIHAIKSKNIDIKKIIKTTLTYSMFVGIIAYLTHIKLTGTGFAELLEEIMAGDVILGASFISVFISSFIITTLASVAGFLFRKGEN